MYLRKTTEESLRIEKKNYIYIYINVIKFYIYN